MMIERDRSMRIAVSCSERKWRRESVVRGRVVRMRHGVSPEGHLMALVQVAGRLGAGATLEVPRHVVSEAKQLRCHLCFGTGRLFFKTLRRNCLLLDARVLTRFAEEIQTEGRVQVRDGVVVVVAAAACRDASRGQAVTSRWILEPWVRALQ